MSAKSTQVWCSRATPFTFAFLQERVAAQKKAEEEEKATTAAESRERLKARAALWGN